MEYRKSVLKHYICGLLVGMIALSVLAFVLETYVSFQASAPIFVFPAFFAAVFAGQKYGDLTERLPEKFEIWYFARVFATVNIAILVLVTSLLLVLDSILAEMLSSTAGMALTVLVIILSWLTITFLSRYAFLWGAKSQLKATAR
ncbi:MAG: ABZJ_00895 family protein [Pseudomonadota bacterium]